MTQVSMTMIEELANELSGRIRAYGGDLSPANAGVVIIALLAKNAHVAAVALRTDANIEAMDRCMSEAPYS